MAAITYDDLIRRVPKWIYAQNRSLVDDMPDIVQEAHNQLIGVLDHDLFRSIITGKQATPASNGILDLSAEDPDVLEIRAVRVRYRNGDDDWTPLRMRDLEMLTELYSRNRPNRPLYYAEYNGPLVIKFFPMPREDYDLEITANVEPPLLTPTNQTNVMSTRAPRALEKAVIRQACLYQKNWEDAQMYEKEMAQAVTEANAQVQRRRRDDTEQRPVEAANVTGA